MARRIGARDVLRLRSVNGLSQNAIARTALVSKHRVQCRPRCPSAISAVPFRDIQLCSSEQILTS